MISSPKLLKQTCFDGFGYYIKTGSSGHILNLFNPPKISAVIVFPWYDEVLTIFFHVFSPVTVICVCQFRFIQVAPLYFFYNLPPSESKDILQDMLDPDGSRKCQDEKQKATTVGSDSESGCAEAPQTYDRCAIQ